MFWIYVGWFFALAIALVMVGFAYSALTDTYMRRDWSDWAMAGFFLLIGIGALVGMYAIQQETTSPILATLHKGYWQCTDTRTELVTTYVMAGKVMVPVTNQVETCIQYSKI